MHVQLPLLRPLISSLHCFRTDRHQQGVHVYHLRTDGRRPGRLDGGPFDVRIPDQLHELESRLWSSRLSLDRLTSLVIAAAFYKIVTATHDTARNMNRIARYLYTLPIALAFLIAILPYLSILWRASNGTMIFSLVRSCGFSNPPSMPMSSCTIRALISPELRHCQLRKHPSLPKHWHLGGLLLLPLNSSR